MKPELKKAFIRRTFSMLAIVMMLAAIKMPLSAMAAGGSKSQDDEDFVASSYSEEQKLVAADGAASDAYGASIAISGNTLVCGAPLFDINFKNDQGVVYVYVLTNGTWAQQAKLVAPDGDVNRQFGYSVAIDGETVVVGARAPAAKGAAYVFVRSGVAWSPQAKLIPNDPINDDRFGDAVAISGNTIVVGAPSHDIAGSQDTNKGAAYVFTRSGASWSQQARLIPNDPRAFGFFGRSVSIDGSSLIVGAPGGSGVPAFDAGTAYVFTRNVNTWSQQVKMMANDAADKDLFGESVSISGNSAAVSAMSAKINGVQFAGAVYVFVRSSIFWSLETKLDSSDAESSISFGSSVSLKNDLLAVGSYQNNVNGKVQQGSAFLFKRSGFAWNLQSTLHAQDGAPNDRFGRAVALDGKFAVVGAPQRNVDSTNTVDTLQHGEAYVFASTPDDLPKILSVVVQSKKLIVTGLNFEDPTEIYVDGFKQKKTANDESSPTTIVIAKKAGRQIDPGTSVIVQVRNSVTGAVSNQFPYTRPIQ